MGAQDEKLPEAIGKRQRVVSLSEGGTIVLTRWTLAKTMTMAGWIAGAVTDLTGFDMTKPENKSREYIEIARDFVMKLGDKLPEFLGLAVDPVDRAQAMDLPLDDALEVIDVIVEMNITPKFLGKAKGLLGRFKSLLPSDPVKPAAVSKST